MLQGEHSAVLMTFIKLLFVINIFVLSIFEWVLYTGFIVFCYILAYTTGQLPEWLSLGSKEEKKTGKHLSFGAVFVAILVTLDNMVK